MENDKKIIEVELFSTLNEIEIIQICGILESNNIPYIRKDSGSGAYMNIYMGQSMQEKKVIVNQKDYKKAVKLLETFFTDVSDEKIKEIEELKEIDTEDEEKLKEEIKKFDLIRKIFGYIYFGLPIIVVSLLVITVILAILG